VTDFVGDAVGQKVAGGTPSWFRSVGAAVVIGVGAAVLAYRLLRSKPSGSDDESAPDDDSAPDAD
jgi:hypothetical protein